MAKLTRDDVLKLAQLARLHLADDEVNQFQNEIQTILGYVEQLQDADVSKLIPTNQVTGLENVMRKDEVLDYGVSPEELLKNAPASLGGHIKVRRVL